MLLLRNKSTSTKKWKTMIADFLKSFFVLFVQTCSLLSPSQPTTAAWTSKWSLYESLQMSFDKIKSCGQSAIGFSPIVLLGDFNAHFNYGDTSLPDINSENNPTQITPSGEAILDLIISELNVKWFPWLFCFSWYSQSTSQLWSLHYLR